MRRLVPLLLLLLLTPAVAFAQDPAPAPVVAEEEDDPGFGRRTPPPLAVDEEPIPDPVPFTEEDPGMAEQLAPAAPTIRRRAPRPHGPLGIKFRASYSTFSNREITDRPISEMDNEWEFENSQFHALGVDIYPFSELFRVGLAFRGAFETGDKDWLATIGMTVGVQLQGKRFTPFVTAGMHSGPARRNFLYTSEADLGPRLIPHLTFLWGFEMMVGVDARLSGNAVGTVALGFQQIGYFSTKGEIENPLFVVKDGTLMLTLGIGY